jgi:predicted PurR-regulated permease PerM
MKRDTKCREKIIFLLPAIFLLIIVIILRKRLIHILVPVIIALLLSYMMEPVVSMFQKKANMKRNHAIMLTFILGLVMLTMVMVFLIPAIAENLKEIVLNIPVIQERVDEIAERIAGMLGMGKNSERYVVFEKYSKGAMDVIEKTSEKMLDAISRSYKKVFNLILDLVTAIILTYYFLKDKEVLSSWILSVFPYDYRNTITDTFYELGKISAKFLQGQLLIAVIIGVLETIGLYLLKVPYAILLGIIGGFSNLIPYFGPFIGAVPAVIVALLASPTKALWTFLLFVGVQQFDNNFLGPKIIEGKLGIHPVTTIIVVFLGGEFFGIAGVFLAVPVYAMIRAIAIRWYRSLLSI